MKKNPENNPLACTGKFCRNVPGPGQGIQFTDKSGKPQRYCTSCWDKKCEADMAACVPDPVPAPEPVLMLPAPAVPEQPKPTP